MKAHQRELISSMIVEYFFGEAFDSHENDAERGMTSEYQLRINKKVGAKGDYRILAESVGSGLSIANS